MSFAVLAYLLLNLFQVMPAEMSLGNSLFLCFRTFLVLSTSYVPIWFDRMPEDPLEVMGTILKCSFLFKILFISGWLCCTGVSVDRVKQLDQKVRDRVGTQLLSLTLRELFTFRYMQARTTTYVESC